MNFQKFTLISASVGIILLSAVSLSAATVFSDDFNGSADPQWSQDSGNWGVTGGVYRANTPSTIGPFRYTSLPFNLSDFSMKMDINRFFNSAIMLRSNFNGGAYNGVMLVTGGLGGGGTGLYWHIWQNGIRTGILNFSGGLFASQSNFSLQIDVSGDTYSAFVNGSTTAATVLTTSLFSSGNVALAQNNNDPFQSFDNIVIDDNLNTTPVPLPAGFALLLTGIGCFVALRRRCEAV